MNKASSIKAGLITGSRKSFLSKLTLLCSVLYHSIAHVFRNLPFVSSPTDDFYDGEIRPSGMGLHDKAKYWEAVYGPFPRPVNEQHLSSYAAWRRIMTELTLTGTVILNALICLVLWFVMGFYLDILLHLTVGERWALSMERMPVFWDLLWSLLGLIPIGCITMLDGVFTLWRPFYSFEQRETYGTAKFLLPKQVHKSRGWLFRYQEPVEFKTTREKLLHYAMLALRSLWLGHVPADPIKHQMFPVAPFGYGTWICYPLAELVRHIVIFGLPGSGKSQSYVMAYVRSAALLGSSLVLDVKGEMFRHCAHLYKKVFRLDFEESHQSDRFLLGLMLRGNYDFSSTVAQSIVGYSNDRSYDGNSKFFLSKGSQLLQAFLLHLAEIDPYFTPSDIFSFMEDHRPEDKGEDGLVATLANSPKAEVRKIIAGMPSRADETFDSIMSSMTDGLETFNDPHVVKIFTPPTQKEYDAGCRVFDPFVLRERGTGVFLVVTEGRAGRLGNVLGTIIDVTYDVLRKTGTKEDADAYLSQHALRFFAPDEIEQFSLLFQAELQKLNGISAEEFGDKFTPEQFQHLLSLKIRDIYLEKFELWEAAENPGMVLNIIDEAGNVNLQGVRKKTGVGRSFKIGFVLIYHNISQMIAQFGRDYTDTVKGIIGTRIFLPGREGPTAKYAAELLGKTTTMQRSATDARKDDFDSSRILETGRQLMMEDEVRTLLEKKQALMVALALEPARIAFPPLQTRLDRVETHAPEYSLAVSPPALEQFDESYFARIWLAGKPKIANKRPLELKTESVNQTDDQDAPPRNDNENDQNSRTPSAEAFKTNVNKEVTGLGFIYDEEQNR